MVQPRAELPDGTGSYRSDGDRCARRAYDDDKQSTLAMQTESDFQAVFGEWLQAQREMLDEWGRTVQSARTDEGKRMVEEMMRAWRTSVEDTLEMQRSWATAFAKELESMDGLSGDVATRMRESAEGLSQWAEAQSDLWGEWFSMAGEVVQGEARSAGEDIVATATAAMQTGISRLMDANRRIMQRMDEASRKRS